MINSKLSLYLICCFLIFSTGFQSSPGSNQKATLDQDTCLAKSFLVGAELHIEKGQYQSAIPILEKAQTLYKRNHMWEQYVKTFIQLSVLCDQIDYDTKAIYAKQALNAAHSYLESNHILWASVYQQMGEVLTAFQKYDSSLYYYQKAVPVFKTAGKWEELAIAKICQSVSYYFLGKISNAKAELEGDFWQKHSFSDEIYSGIYDLQGVYYFEEGDVDKTIEITQNALQFRLNKKERTTIDSSYIANHLNNLGTAYNTKGDPRRALDYFQQAGTIFKKLNNELESKLISYNNIGKLLNAQYKYEEAIDYLKANVAEIYKLEEQQIYLDDLEEAYFNLGVAYRHLELYDSAFYYFEKTISLPLEQKLTIPFTALGKLYLQLNQPHQALTSFKKAKEDLINLKRKANIYLPLVYYGFGKAYFQLEQLDSALFYFHQSLIANDPEFKGSVSIYDNPRSSSQVFDPIFFLDALQAKAQTLTKLSKEKKDLRASLETYQLAIQFTDSLRQDYILEDNELFWSQRFKEIYSEAIHTAYRLFEKEQNTSYLELAFRLAEKSKASLLLQAFKTNTGQASSGVSTELIQQERDLSINVAYYEKSLAKAIEQENSAKIDLYQNYLVSSRLELAQLKEQMERDYPDYFALKYSDNTLDLAKVQQNLLDDQTALLEYFIGEEQAYVFVLSSRGLQVIPLAITEEFHQRIAHFNKALFQTEGFQANPKKAYDQFNLAAYQAYQAILKEAIEGLSPSVKRLIIVPDGALNTLPFEVLNRERVEAPGTNFAKLPYVLKDFQVHYGYSINLLLKNRERKAQLPANVQCLAFAPTYQNKQPIAQADVRSNQLRNGITNLKGTAAEIQAINAYFKGSFDTTAIATKARFLEQVDQYGILHLAMHGEADFENTKFGHLIFTNKNTQDKPDQHLLYHYEIANLSLNAQLAVLSACETGLGKYEAGEGVFSLARSFMYAGVPSVVMSLWKVNDLSTSQLMPSFYEQLAKGKTKDEALQQAKLRFLEEAAIEYRHPYFWSGFVALGDAQPLKRPMNRFQLWGMVALGIVLSGGWFAYKTGKATSQ